MAGKAALSLLSRKRLIPSMKLRYVFVVLLLSAALPACSPGSSDSSGALEILATTSIIGDVVLNVGGEHIDLSVLLPPGKDPHAFAPSPQDIVAITEAELVFANGLDLEVSLAGFLEGRSEPVKVVFLSEDFDAEDSGDPHVWMDPENVFSWVDAIAFELSILDAANASSYQANAEAYKVQLTELDAWARTQIAVLDPSQRILLTDHQILTQFAAAYGFEVLGSLFPGGSSLSEPSASELAELENTIQKYNLPVLFLASPEGIELATQIGTDTGIRIVPIYVESLSDPAGPAASYLEMMRYDVNAIVNALK